MKRPPPKSSLFPYTTLFRSFQPGLAEFELAPGDPDHVQKVVDQPDHVADLPLHRPEHFVHDGRRSEEHTSELQSRQYLVCRLLLEKKKTAIIKFIHYTSTDL